MHTELREENKNPRYPVRDAGMGTEIISV